MPHISTLKVIAGFEYRIGALVIARALWWRKGPNGWTVRLTHMLQDPSAHARIYADKELKLGEVIPYLVKLMQTENHSENTFQTDAAGPTDSVAESTRER